MVPAICSPSSDSCHEDADDCSDGGQDSPGVTSPLLVRSPVKSIGSGGSSGGGGVTNVSTAMFKPLGRQKRLANFYGTNIPWRSRDRRSIHGGDINSD